MEALEGAIVRVPKPQIMNTDHSSQVTGREFTGVVEERAIATSMDGKCCWRDNVLVGG